MLLLVPVVLTSIASQNCSSEVYVLENTRFYFWSGIFLGRMTQYLRHQLSNYEERDTFYIAPLKYVCPNTSEERSNWSRHTRNAYRTALDCTCTGTQRSAFVILEYFSLIYAVLNARSSRYPALENFRRWKVRLRFPKAQKNNVTAILQCALKSPYCSAKAPRVRYCIIGISGAFHKVDKLLSG